MDVWIESCQQANQARFDRLSAVAENENLLLAVHGQLQAVICNRLFFFQPFFHTTLQACTVPVDLGWG